MFKFLTIVFIILSLAVTPAQPPIRPETPPLTPSDTPYDEPLKPVTLSWYNVSSSIVDSTEVDKVVSELNKTLKQKLNVTLKYYLLDQGIYEDKLNVKFAGGDQIDLCYTSKDWINKYSIGVETGKFLELDDLLSKYGKDILAASEERFWDTAKIKGKTYGILNVQNYAYGKGITFNKAIVDDLGLQDDIDKLKYSEDLGALLAKVKAEFDKRPEYAKYMLLGELPDMPNKMQEAEFEDISGTCFSVKRGDPNFNLVIKHETDWGKYGFKLRREWFEKGYITREAAIIKVWSSIFRKGRLFCTSFDATRPGAESELELSYGMPVIIKETRPPVITTGSLLSSMTAISCLSKNPERAMMLANLMFTDKEAYNTLAWGIKDVHYTMVDENTIKLTNKQFMYNPSNKWAIGNSFNSYLTDKEDPQLWEESMMRNETAQFATTYGFMLDASKYPAEFAMMSETMARNMRVLNSGLVDVDIQLEKLDAELKNIGYEKLQDEVAKQLKEFRLNKIEQ